MIEFLKIIVKGLVRAGVVLGFLTAGFIVAYTLRPDKDVFEDPKPEYTIEESASRSPQSSTEKTLILGSENTIVFREIFSAGSVAKIQYELLKTSLKIGPKKTIYLVLDTPGGSVTAGQDLINFVNALPNKVTTVTLFAASMGYISVQNIRGPRLIADQGVLMSHRARLGLQGEVPGEFLVRLKWIMESLSKLERRTARRVKMSIKSYQNLIRDEYWVEGRKAVSDKMADFMVNLRCGKSLTGTSEVTVRTMFGPVNLTYSDCPLIRYPIAVDFSGTAFAKNPSLENSKKYVELKEFIQKLAFSKKDFVTDYIVNSKYQEFIK